SHVLFFSYVCSNKSDLESFPTRRSSDLEPVSMKANEQTPEVFKEEKDEEHVQEIFLNEVKNEFNKNSTSLNVKQELVPAPISLADRKSTRLNSSHVSISYAVFCLKKKKI